MHKCRATFHPNLNKMSYEKTYVKHQSKILIPSIAILLGACNSSSSDEDNNAGTPDPKYPDYAFIKNLGDQATAIGASDSGHGFFNPHPNVS